MTAIWRNDGSGWKVIAPVGSQMRPPSTPLSRKHPSSAAVRRTAVVVLSLDVHLDGSGIAHFRANSTRALSLIQRLISAHSAENV